MLPVAESNLNNAKHISLFHLDDVLLSPNWKGYPNEEYSASLKLSNDGTTQRSNYSLNQSQAQTTVNTRVLTRGITPPEAVEYL